MSADLHHRSHLVQCYFLIDALRRIAEALDQQRAADSRAEQQLVEHPVRTLTRDLPGLPDFSGFDPVFRSTPTPAEGDIPSTFYAGYSETDREYVRMTHAAHFMHQGRRLVSTTFVVPYPPGFPVLAPGQRCPSESST